MIDFNSSASLSGRLQELFDRALEAERDTTPARDYLGASRLGASCERQLQRHLALRRGIIARVDVDACLFLFI